MPVVNLRVVQVRDWRSPRVRRDRKLGRMLETMVEKQKANHETDSAKREELARKDRGGTCRVLCDYTPPSHHGPNYLTIRMSSSSPLPVDV